MYNILVIWSIVWIYSRRPKSGRLDFGVLDNRPAAKHVRFLKSGHKRPDFERSVHSLYNVRISNVRVSINQTSVFRHFIPKLVPNRFQTSSELVPNRFWSNTSEIRTYGYNPDVRNPDNSKSGRFFVRFAKLDVRYPALHCTMYGF